MVRYEEERCGSLFTSDSNVCCLIDVQLEILFANDLRQIRELQLAMSRPMGEVFQCLVTGLGSLILTLSFS